MSNLGHGAAAAPPNQVHRRAACLADLRADLARSYPRFSRRRLSKIAASHGLRRLPDALLLNDSPSPGIARELNRFVRRLRGEPSGPRREHPLFSSEFYRMLYPDVGRSRVVPWLHYQVFGRSEGRSPHPLLDIAGLARQLPTALPGEVLDAYLIDPRNWLASPGPYVDAERFMLAGPWNGTTNPLLQILRDYPSEPWVRVRLGLIDLGTSTDAVRLAAGLLAVRQPALASATSLSMWRPPASEPQVRPNGPYRVVPGFFAGIHGELLTVGPGLESGDGTALRAGDGVVCLDAGERVATRRLVYLATEDADASGLVPDAGTLFAPTSPAQEARLRACGARVLAYGRQVTVAAEEFSVARVVPGKGVPS